jgi:hypothetical protein
MRKSTTIKICTLLIISLWSINFYGQNGEIKNSDGFIALRLGYPYYFMNLEKYSDYIDVNNKFNFSISGSYGIQFKSRSLEFGVGYCTKNYVFNYNNDDFAVSSKEGKLKYMFIPIILNQNLYLNHRQSVSGLIGVIFLRPFDFSKVTNYRNGEQETEDNINVDFKTGIQARLGLVYSRKISELVHLFCEIYGGYKFVMDYHESHPDSDYENLTDDRFSIGLNVGVNLFIFNK